MDKFKLIILNRFYYTYLIIILAIVATKSDQMLLSIDWCWANIEALFSSLGLIYLLFRYMTADIHVYNIAVN